MMPQGRDAGSLAWEVEHGWVSENAGHLTGFAALHAFGRGGALEGPLSLDGAGDELLSTAVYEAKKQGYPTVYAFPAEENGVLRELLERHDFHPMHATYFFSTGPANLDYPLPLRAHIEQVEALWPELYRDLYRRSEEAWSQRLGWSDAELIEHFVQPEITLWFAYQSGMPVGLVELEQAAKRAEVAYLGVVPEARGQGIGRALLGMAARHAFDTLKVQELVVRAHDHEKSAIDLYRGLGFRQVEVVVTYVRELEL